MRRMANKGDVLENPFTGQTLTFRRTAADTGGELLEVESRWAGGGQEPPEHHHPSQEEHFEVVEGELRARLGGEERTVRAGETLVVPVRTPHSMWNPGPGPARAVWQTRPALKTEAFFELVWGLARATKENPADSPSADEVAAMMREYEGEFRLGRPEPG
jgi:mannose-6-phosphate isomerase-like protein (cupin superfamily)